MTLVSTIIQPARTVGRVLPSDPQTVASLADRLDGRPVPGVRMSQRQFLAWTPEGIRAEWEAGEIILMTTPSVTHARRAGWIYRLLCGFVEARGLGEVFMPLSARLGTLDRIRDPDVLFVAASRSHLIRANHFDGPPDLAVEVVSPDSVVRDWRTKHHEYEAAGVREYWVVDPLTRRFEAYTAARKKFRLLPVDGEGRVHSKVLRGLHVHPAWFWKTPLPNLGSALSEMGANE